MTHNQYNQGWVKMQVQEKNVTHETKLQDNE